MMGAIVQAIDHALGRMHEGMGSGIKVADSQGGGAVDASNATGSIANTSQAGDSIKNATKATTELDVKDKIDSGVGSEETSEKEEEVGTSILSDERLKHARKHAEDTVKKWHRK